MNWYSFTPQDTLFFRGAESAEMGADHSASTLFPPPVQTIMGALRTAVLMQNAIPFSEYTGSSFNNETIISSIGKSDDPSPFAITGPLFMEDDNVYVPAPYSWFMDENKSKGKRGNNHVTKDVSVLKSETLSSRLFVSDDVLEWTRGKDLQTMGGKWIQVNSLREETVTLYDLNYFAEPEVRTGIALRGRSVREGHLYSFRHYRLKPGIQLLFGVDKDLPIAEKGTLRLGAEKRFGEYNHLKDISIQHKGGTGKYMSLSIIEGSSEVKESVVATGKPQYIGGWDMKKRFHKPMKGYFPAGTVLREAINNNCIEL
mgnify:CR=1 FL=1